MNTNKTSEDDGELIKKPDGEGGRKWVIEDEVQQPAEVYGFWLVSQPLQLVMNDNDTLCLQTTARNLVTVAYDVH